MMLLRPYQRAAIDALYDYFAGNTGNPLVVMPTGTGKSVVIASFIREAIHAYPETRILMLTHVKELIAQNFQALIRMWPEAPGGIYSAGLSRRDIHAQVLFAGIQSIHKHAARVQRCDLVIIDEAHLLSRTDGSMYRAFLSELNSINAGLMKVVGFTATPYRMDTGLLHVGKDRVFTDIAYSVPILDMIAQGYLSTVIPKQTQTQLDVSSVGTRGGEFIAKDLEAAVDRDDVTRAAVAEIVQHGAERGSWLIFCSGVAHARHVRDAIREHGISAETVTGDTPPGERDSILTAYKAGKLRCVTNANVLTTGFDAPGTDLVALLRPTKSIGLYVQMVGRGTRLAPGKDDCIAEGQRVLTDCGLVPIERVTTRMKVWDGHCFVSHCGAILRGESEVISYAGITATPDHKVWTEEGWKALGQCAFEQASIAVTGYGGTPVRQDDGRFRRGGAETRTRQTACFSGMPRLPNAVSSGLFELDGGQGGLSILCQTTTGTGLVGQEGDFRQAAMHQSEECELSSIWRARNSVRVPVSNSNGGMGPGEFGTSPRIGVRQDQQRRPVCPREPPINFRQTQYDEPGQQETNPTTSCLSVGSPGNHLCGRNAGSHVQRGPDDCTNRGEVRQPVRQTKRRVWDILNAGPRHSFTVEGLLVHNCMVLDFAGNTMRHGPIDTVDGARKEKGDEPGDAPVKTCPECQTINHASARRCISCGFDFPPPKIQVAPKAATGALLSTQIQPEWCDVTDVRYAAHVKPGKPTSLRVTYQCGLTAHSEWVCFEHTGYARSKAEAWWRRRTDAPIPATVEIAIVGAPTIAKPTAIQVRPVGKYVEILGVRF